MKIVLPVASWREEMRRCGVQCFFMSPERKQFVVADYEKDNILILKKLFQDNNEPRKSFLYGTCPEHEP